MISIRARRLIDYISFICNSTFICPAMPLSPCYCLLFLAPSSGVFDVMFFRYNVTDVTSEVVYMLDVCVPSTSFNNMSISLSIAQIYKSTPSNAYSGPNTHSEAFVTCFMYTRFSFYCGYHATIC